MLNDTYKYKKLLYKIILNKNICPIVFVRVLFALGRLNYRIYGIDTFILPKLEKPDYVLWHSSKVYIINTVLQG